MQSDFVETEFRVRANTQAGRKNEMPYQNRGFLSFMESTSFDTYVCIDVYHRGFFVVVVAIICLFGGLARAPYITHSCFKRSNMYGIALIYNPGSPQQVP